MIVGVVAAEDRRVGPGAAVDGVASRAAGDHIVAAPTRQRVGAGGSVEGLIGAGLQGRDVDGLVVELEALHARDPVDPIWAGQGEDPAVAVIAHGVVGPVPGEDRRVSPAAAEDHVVAETAGQDVVARGARQHIRAAGPVQGRAAGGRDHEVRARGPGLIAVGAVDQTVQRIACAVELDRLDIGERVGPIVAIADVGVCDDQIAIGVDAEGVVLNIAPEHGGVGAGASEQPIVSSVAIEPVVPGRTPQRIVPVAAMDGVVARARVNMVVAAAHGEGVGAVAAMADADDFAGRIARMAAAHELNIGDRDGLVVEPQGLDIRQGVGLGHAVAEGEDRDRSVAVLPEIVVRQIAVIDGDVGPRPAVDHVGPVPAGDGVVAGSGGDGVDARRRR